MRRTDAQSALQLMEADVSRKHAFALGAAMAFIAGLTPVNAQDNRDRVVDQFRCRDIMRDSGADRDVAIAFLHGFLLGKSGHVQFNLDDLHKRTDVFIEHCLSNPDEKAIDAMTAVRR